MGRILVLAGVNGAGKSSLLGTWLEAEGLSWFNPDSFTRRLVELGPQATYNDRETVRSWFGARGDAWDGWKWEASFAYGQFTQDQVRAAIVAAFSGQDGGSRARIGTTLYVSRFYAPVALLGSWAQIVYIKIGSTNAPAASFTASVAGSTMTVTAVAGGTLAVGQTIVDPQGGLAAGPL